MRRRRDATTRLLAWYPPAWRERYGEEMGALLDDTLDGHRPTLALRASLAGAGLRQRLRDAGLTGDHASASERRRAGSLVVLVAWSAFVVGGAGFAKATEHYSSSLPRGQGSMARAAYDVVVVGAAAAGVAVALGALMVVPSLRRHLRAGGWSAWRRRVRGAVASTVAAGVATVALTIWAHHLTLAQRNGGDARYGAAFVAWALLGLLALARVTSFVVAVTAAMELPRRVLKVEARLALIVAGGMLAATAGALTWWVEMARRAPSFLTGGTPANPAGGLPVNLAGATVVMVAALGVAALGALRAVRGGPRDAVARPDGPR